MGVYEEHRKLIFAPGPKFKKKGISNGIYRYTIINIVLIVSINKEQFDVLCKRKVQCFTYIFVEKS